MALRVQCGDGDGGKIVISNVVTIITTLLTQSGAQPDFVEIQGGFLASQDALEVIGVTHSLTYSSLADLTDVTLVSEDAAHNSLPNVVFFLE